MAFRRDRDQDLHVATVRYRSAVSSSASRPARVADVHAVAAAMPYTTVEGGSQENPVYQIGGKSFVFFRNPRPDAFDPDTGERYDDVIVIWVESEDDKAALVQDPNSPFFTTDHFNGPGPSSSGPVVWAGSLERNSSS